MPRFPTLNFVPPKRIPTSGVYFRNKLAKDKPYITKELLRNIDLKPIKSITFQYDPFRQAQSIRETSLTLSIPSWRKTNLGCLFKMDIKSDAREPNMTVNFMNGNELEIRTANLSNREVIEILIAQTQKNIAV